MKSESRDFGVTCIAICILSEVLTKIYYYIIIIITLQYALFYLEEILQKCKYA